MKLLTVLAVFALTACNHEQEVPVPINSEKHPVAASSVSSVPSHIDVPVIAANVPINHVIIDDRCPNVKGCPEIIAAYYAKKLHEH